MPRMPRPWTPNADERPTNETTGPATENTAPVPEGIETDAQVVLADEEIVAALDKLEIPESQDFPLLQRVLLLYFRHYSGVRRRDVAFIKRYQRTGENSVEFEGLADEIRKAIKSASLATPMVNEALDTALTREQVRRHLVSLLDQMLKKGEFSEEEMKAKKQEEAEAKATPQELLDGYLFRRVNPFPGRFRAIYFPVWQAFAASFGSIVVGVLLATYIPWPQWLRWLPVLFMSVGLVGLAITSVAMTSLRDELRNPKKEEDRQKAKEALSLKKARAAERAERWRKLLD